MDKNIDNIYKYFLALYINNLIINSVKGLVIDFLTGLHSFIVNGVYWLIGIHIIAAIYHRLRKDNVWSSMVPFFKEK